MNYGPSTEVSYSGMEHTIFAQIRRENDYFMYNFISPVPGYSFNQYMTIKRIFLYLNNKFENSEGYLGRAKLFYNIVTPPCEVATKMLNIDTKDIKLIPINDPKNYFPVYLLEKELRVWLKTSKMGQLLNQIAEEGPRYGSVVLEKTKDGAEVVDLRRLFLDPAVDKIGDSRFVTTIHYMTETQLRETKWDNVDVAIQRFANTEAPTPFEDRSGNVNQMRSSPLVKVYKRYGEVPERWIKGANPNSNKIVKALFIVAGPDELQKNTEGRAVGELGVILFSSRWYKGWPFKDFNYNKIKGRFLGMGVVESLFDVQVRMNELKNQKRISMELSQIHLFQSKDKMLARNVLTDLENGDILYSPSGIEPIQNEERNLSAFESEEAAYLQQADKLTFAYEALRGELPPSTTPLGTTQIAVAQATGVYGFKRQNMALFLRDYFNDLVMPQLMSDLSPEHIMRFTGTQQEIDKLDKAASELYVNDVIKKLVLSNSKIDPQVLVQAKDKAINEYRKMGVNRFIKIKEQFYKNAEFEFDFNIDNEQVDPASVVQNIQAILGFAQNPALLQDPRFKMLFYKMSEALGVSPGELEMVDEEAKQMNQNGQLPSLNQQDNGQLQTSGGGVQGGQQKRDSSGGSSAGALPVSPPAGLI